VTTKQETMLCQMERKTHLFRELHGARKILHMAIVLLYPEA